MKIHVVSLIAFISFIQSASSQVIKDKNEFAKAFITVFNQRETGFDSLRVNKEDDFEKSRINLPGAKECFISDNDVYGAEYDFTDSLKALAFYKELKGLLSHAASYYKATVRYSKMLPEDPFYEIFYFTDSVLFTNEGSTICFSRNTAEDDDIDEDDETAAAKTKPAATFEVRLLINPGASVSYYTSATHKVNDPDIANVMRVIAFGKDTALKNIRINPRPQKDQTLYGSKMGLKGFATEISEIRRDKKTGINTSFSRKYFMSMEAFVSQVDSMIAKINTVLPANYYYEVFRDEQGVLVEFKTIPFMPASGKEAEISMQYAALEGKTDAFELRLNIHRVIYNNTRP